jgi:DNA-directed RNA polymerase III subunit RPC1
VLSPIRAYDIMCKMIEEDMILMWMDGVHSRPDTLIMFAVPVPPVPIRPSVPMDVGK